VITQSETIDYPPEKPLPMNQPASPVTEREAPGANTRSREISFPQGLWYLGGKKVEAGA